MRAPGRPSWTSRAWAELVRWLEVGTTEASARRSVADAEDAPDRAPFEPETGGIAVLPIEDSIDLHHFRPRDVPSVVSAYLESAHERGFEEVRIIHGRGKGVQRSIVAKVLTQHPLVVSFGPGVGAAALGATVARLARGKKGPKTKTSRGF